MGLVAWRVTRPDARSRRQRGQRGRLPERGVARSSTDHPAELAAFYTQDVGWKPCEGSPAHQCTRIEVPVDYAEPDGDTFEVALRKVPDPRSVQEGRHPGPQPRWAGASGLEYAQFSSFLFGKQVREAYDIMGFDPRGIGQSDAVACLTDDDMDLLFENDPTPDDAAEQEKPLGDAEAITEALRSSRR